MIKTITLLLWLGCVGMAVGRVSPAPTPPATAEFIQNKGQWPAAVRFAAPLAAGQLFIENNGFTYALLTPRRHHAAASDTAARPQGHAYRVRLLGALPGGPVGEQQTAERRNYFCGNDSARWARDVPSFRAVQYAAVYPGIGLRVYENASQQLEYTFTVQPEGRPAAIALQYEGTDGLRLDAAGNLVVSTRVGQVTEQAPRAWQVDAAGRHQPVACAFALAGSTVTFALGPYDARRPLVIDPVVVFATFTGSTADNWGHTATYDAQGNLYSAGTVFAQGYPTSPGAFDPSFNGSIDVAIIKYDPRQFGPAARVYATYLGGGGTDVPHRLAVDGAGELVVLGTTGSANFPHSFFSLRRFKGGPPVIPEYGIAYPEGADLFVTRLSADGRRLVGSTYLGGSGTDGLPFAGSSTTGNANTTALPQLGFAAWRGDVQVDGQGNVYVATSTASADFPGLNAFQTTYRGGATDAVVCRLSPDLQTLQWSAFVGGRSADAAFGLTLAPNGLVYVAGSSTSADLPITAGAFQPANKGGADGFVAALTSDGQALRYLCRTGTADADAAEFIQADAASTIYIAGLSNGQLPTTPGSLGDGGIFVQQFSADLGTSLFTTSLGALHTFNDLTLSAFRVDDCGAIYLAAVGFTQGLPLTTGARPYESTYVAQLSARGRTLDFGACYTGDHTHGISRFGPDGALYQAICAHCQTSRNSFVIPLLAYYYSSTAPASNCNDASLKIAVAPVAGTSTRQLCVGAGPLPLGGNPAGGVWTGPGVAPAPGGGFQFVPTPALLGTNTLTYTPPAGSSCASTRLAINLIAPEVAIIDPIGPFCVAAPGTLSSILLQARPAGGEFSGPGVSQGYFRPYMVGPGTYTITYSFNVDGRCGSGSINVRVLGQPLVVSADTTLCGKPFRAFQLRASPAGGTWAGYGVSTTGLFNPAQISTSGGATYAVATYSFNSADGCKSQRAVRILLVPDAPVLDQPPPSCPLRPDIAGFPPFTLKLPALPNDYVARYSWDFGDGEVSGYFQRPAIESHTYITAGTFVPVLRIDYAGGCPRTITLPPVVVGEPQPLPNIFTPNGDQLNEFFIQRQFCELPTLRVYSRWGQEVYHAAQYRNDWNAAGLPDGVYYYRFEGERRQTVKGWLEVRH
ncbi:gliding motility-associated C-terminal domain-containing protein [Hymenobacter sp. M29]|uniref:Gliding motility-associated C-terminal domain-containing protein n=1 Tax=Hymenobacter mellowenesis TaxID=3063995 RepID=A0ABT9AEQ4_9BACT|nr:gliding motility-associated C-terminal domain-containing protein [Hymenobacter sp. M29]MDO7847877.1 gliding motility-associated C-terminal domain-containing protein [Hymenobacter sp. M29]